MFEHVARASIWLAILPSLIFAILLGSFIALCVVLFFVRGVGAWTTALVPVAICFSILGVIIGQVGGFSSVSVTGAIISGTISILAALLIHVIGSKGKRVQITTSTAVVAFSISLLFGLHFGSDIRHRRENFELSKEFIEQRIKDIENVRNSIAVKRLVKESQFNELKTGLEKQTGTKLETKYNEIYKPDWDLILRGYR